MKKLLFALIAILYLPICFYPFVLAKANDTGYLRVITEDTPLYKDENLTNFACYLPYTYYVKVIEYLDDVVHVECYGNNIPKIDGYVLKEQLFNDGLSVENPYLDVKIKTADNTEFYKNCDLTDVIQYIFPDRTLFFYGHVVLANGEKAYYVSYNGNLGYVKEEKVFPFTISNHPNELTFITPPEDLVIPNDKPSINENQPSDGRSDNPYVLRIVIILSIILAGFIAVFTFKSPKKTNNTSVYYDENEYR